jgi:PST family polysaccharide transporter
MGARMPGLASRAVRGVAWLTLGGWGARVVQLVVLALLARVLAPSDFGLFAISSVFAALVGVLQDLGIPDALVQRAEIDPAHLDSAHAALVAIGGALAVLSWLTAPLVADLYGEPELTAVAQVLGVTFALSAPGLVPRSLMRRELRFDRIAGAWLAGSVAGGVAAVALAWRGHGALALAAGRAVECAVTSVGLRSSCGWRPTTRLVPARLRELVAFGVPVAGFRAINFANRHGDDLLIGWFLGPVWLGFYDVAYRVFRTGSNLLIEGAYSVGLPVFAQLAADRESLRRGYLQTTRALAAIATPAFLGLAAVAPDFVRLAFGAGWEPAVPVLRVLAFVGLLHAVQTASSPLLVATGRPGARLLFAGASAVANLVAFWIAVRFGIVAVALAFAIRAYLFAPLLQRLVAREIGVGTRELLASIAGPTGAALAMALVVLALNAWLAPQLALPARLAVSVGIGVALYAAGLGMAAPQLLRDWLHALRSLAQPAEPRTST